MRISQVTSDAWRAADKRAWEIINPYSRHLGLDCFTHRHKVTTSNICFLFFFYLLYRYIKKKIDSKNDSIVASLENKLNLIALILHTFKSKKIMIKVDIYRFLCKMALMVMRRCCISNTRFKGTFYSQNSSEPKCEALTSRLHSCFHVTRDIWIIIELFPRNLRKWRFFFLTCLSKFPANHSIKFRHETKSN